MCHIMPLEIPLTYSSEKNKKYSSKALKILRIIIELVLILGLTYSIYNNKYIWVGAFGAAIVFSILERIKRKK